MSEPLRPLRRLRYKAQVSPPSLAALIDRIARRVLVHAVKMIYDANHRDDVAPGDPKVGGHPASSASSLHILSALHLGVRRAEDVLAMKPHASPVDHAINHALGLFHRTPLGTGWLDEAEAQAVMGRLRKRSVDGEPVFQSYHAPSDPDAYWYLPAGSVGIPAVVLQYTSLAYRYARDHGWTVPAAPHFWSLMGDSELREGSLTEAMPDAAERELGDVTWIVDYNRQNLDGPRLGNPRGLGGSDADRLERTALANGWQVLQIRHGAVRRQAFERAGGAELRALLEDGVSDHALQMLLTCGDGAKARLHLIEAAPKVADLLAAFDDDGVMQLLSDLGGHDVEALLTAFGAARVQRTAPMMIIAHTLKGWGLACAAEAGNHSALPNEAEMSALLRREGLTAAAPFARFDPGTAEGQLLEAKGRALRSGTERLWQLASDNRGRFTDAVAGGLPPTLGLNLEYVPMAHTQYAWGQLAAKLVRLGGDESPSQRVPTDDEKRWAPVAQMLVTMAPDVGTSTNINRAMDDRVYGPAAEPDWQAALGIVDRRRPKLAPRSDAGTGHLRFDIAEASCMCAAGAFGKLRDRLGIPLAPVMTVYDFFIKRAFDQLYYNLYWQSSFIVVGTPSGVTLSPEGAQHSWKSDIQMPNVISWEPFFAQEMDWIVAETLRRQYLGDDQGRQGVIIRGVTRAFAPEALLDRLRSMSRFEGLVDSEILEATRAAAIEGAYYLVDHRGARGYEPAENVVHIFALGPMAAEALLASDRLLADGIFANVIVVTCADLLCGNLAAASGYRHLLQGLGVDGDLHLTAHGGPIADSADLVLAAGRRVPLVAVVDGEPGLVDNLGSVVGVKAETLGVRQASKCGRPSDVYAYLGIDAAAVYDACGRVLTETAIERVRVSSGLLASMREKIASAADPETERLDLWPPRR